VVAEEDVGRGAVAELAVEADVERLVRVRGIEGAAAVRVDPHGVRGEVEEAVGGEEGERDEDGNCEDDETFHEKEPPGGCAGSKKKTRKQKPETRTASRAP
jgi:hypothetical protein